MEVTSISVGEVVRRIAASRRLVPIAAVIGLVLGVVAYLLLPRTYVSEATLLPSSGQDSPAMGGNLLSLAGSLGISLPGASVPESHLFPTILKSERIIGNALDTPVDPADPSRGDLYSVLRDDDVPENLRHERTVERVRQEILRVGLDEETGIVRMVVRLDDPRLANRTAAIFLDELAHYLREERNARSRENREFIESRRADADRALAQAEEELRAFREANRKIGNSPDLLLEQERLARALRVQEEVFLELTRQFEIARIEEQKAMPVLEILDPPTLRFRPKSPKLPLLAGIGLLVGTFLGSILAVVLESPGHSSAGLLTTVRHLLGLGGRRTA